MYDMIKKLYGGIPMNDGCCGGSCTPRSFLTREEKIELLKDYAENLRKEAQGVTERIKELEKVK